MGAYYGSDGKAKEITDIYAGVLSDVYTYKETTYPWNDNLINFLKFFKSGVRESNYNIDDAWEIDTPTFSSYGYRFCPKNLAGRTSCYFEIVWEALVDMTVQCAYSYITEPTYDKVTIKIGTITVLSNASGSHSSITKTSSCQIKKGDAIRCIYYKDGSNDANNEKVEFYINVLNPTSITIKEQTGSEKKDVARKILKGYLGINGIAKKFYPPLTEVDITYTGTMTTEQIKDANNKNCQLHTLTNTGTLTINGTIVPTKPIQLWMCGGGGDGSSQYNRGAGYGGGGGYERIRQITETGEYTIEVGSANGNTYFRHNGVTAYAPCGGSNGGSSNMGGSGGGAGGEASGGIVSYYKTAGQKESDNYYPFGIQSMKAHCAGGGAGPYLDPFNSYYANGGNGGSEGSDGGIPSLVNSFSLGTPGKGGNFGGGDGATYSSGKGSNATFYGGGGGGAFKHTNTAISSSPGKGYQGVVYLLVPLE